MSTRRIVVETLDARMAEVLRSKTGAQRLQIVDRLHDSMRQLLITRLGDDHPQWDINQIRAEVARRFLCDAE